MMAQAIKCLASVSRDPKKMVTSQNERAPKSRVVRLGGREIITEGLNLNFWADISHRCMTASWPAFIGGAALVFIAFNAVFAVLYWIGNQPISGRVRTQLRSRPAGGSGPMYTSRPPSSSVSMPGE